jgi:hypothetical protein
VKEERKAAAADCCALKGVVVAVGMPHIHVWGCSVCGSPPTVCGGCHMAGELRCLGYGMQRASGQQQWRLIGMVGVCMVAVCRPRFLACAAGEYCSHGMSLAARDSVPDHGL